MRCLSRIYNVVGLVLIINVSPCFPTDVNTQNEESKHLVSAQSAQPQGPVKEAKEVEIQQKAEQPVAIKNELNRQLLHLASSAGTTFVKTLYINNLLSKGADINAVDEYGLTFLHHAVKQGNKDIITLLLANGAIVDYKDNAGRTPLHYAAGAGHSSAGIGYQNLPANIVEFLLDNNADINAQDKIGWTPLHYAVSIRDKNIVELLVNKEADLFIVNDRGETAYAWNRERAAFEAQHSINTPHELINVHNEIAKVLHSRFYVVALDGKEGNPGTLERPFKTITAALEVVGPGDVIYIRGGAYRCDHSIRLDKSGARGNPISLRAYAGEVPILDFSDVKEYSLLVSGAYWHIKGVVVKNGYYGVMVFGPAAHHNILEQMISSANGWGGILFRDDAAHNIALNCDSYRNFDPEFSGDTCDGFSVAFNVGQGNTFIGNRSWNNSDDGYDCWKAGEPVRFETCYSWNSGQNIWNYPFFTGNGNGFKLGGGEGRHVFINCLAWGHKWGAGAGFTLNGNSSGVILRSCSAWGNGINYQFASDYWESRGGAQEDCVFMNNISLDGERKDTVDREAISQSNNWDSATGAQLTDDDFLSLDDNQMSAPRNPDGSIPQNNFLKLAPGSVAIDKGTDVGMPFVGARPDLGAFEYDPNETSEGYMKMLHQAVRDHDVEEINNLLTAGAGINDKDWLGYTPLHWAVYFGYSDLIELLISKGADPDIQSDTGRYALAIARAMAYPELEALLRKLGAKAGDVSTDEDPKETKAAEGQKQSTTLN